MFSIYTSIYNLSLGFIDYKAAVDNFSSFADEVCISTSSKCTDNTIKLLKDYIKDNNKVKLIITDLDLNTFDFDGKIKDAALKACTQKYCILLDGDERLRLKDKDSWIKFANLLGESNTFDAFMIPVIDLYNSEHEYKSISRKWYLHKNSENIHRGIVNFAKRDNNTIYHGKSDTCELLTENGDLVKTASIEQTLTVEEIIDGDLPKVFHLGWLDKENRLKSNKFWQSIWNLRAGFEVTDKIKVHLQIFFHRAC